MKIIKLQKKKKCINFFIFLKNKIIEGWWLKLPMAGGGSATLKEKMEQKQLLSSRSSNTRFSESRS
jgi:hypothetical protein